MKEFLHDKHQASQMVGQQWDKQLKPKAKIVSPIVSYMDVWNLLLEPMT
jgi:hypothetical protein